MNSDSFDQYIKDKITSLDNKPLKQWDSSSVWQQLESKKKTSFFIGWKNIAIAASIILLLGNTLILLYQYNNKCQEISVLVKEKQADKKYLLQIEKQLSNSNIQINIARQLNIKDKTEYEKQISLSRIQVLPVIIRQADIIINNSQQEVKFIVINTEKKESIHSKIPEHTLEITYKDKETEPIKRKFKINLFNKRNNIFAYK